MYCVKYVTRDTYSTRIRTLSHIADVLSMYHVLGNSCSAVLCQLTVFMEEGGSKMQEFTEEPSVDFEGTTATFLHLIQ